MEAKCSSEISVTFPRTARRYILEDRTRLKVLSWYHSTGGILQRDEISHTMIELSVISVDFAECGRYCIIQWAMKLICSQTHAYKI
jgi:hypothetical protein